MDVADQSECGSGGCTGWERRRLEEISAFITKGATPTTHGFAWTDGGVLFLRSECISERGLDLTASMSISEAAHSFMKRSECIKGDILMTITGNVGRVVRLTAIHRANINQHIARLRVIAKDVDPAYVYHVLSQPSVRRSFESIVTGQAYPQISLSQVRAAEIALPTERGKQAAVCSALDDTDALIDSLQQLVAKKRQIKEGAMQELLTGRRRLPGFASAWQTFALGDLFTFSGGMSASREQLSQQGHCYLHYGDIHRSGKVFVDVVDEYTCIPKLDIPLDKVPRGALLANGDVVFVDASEDEEGTSKHVVVVNPTRIPFIAGLHTIVAKAKNDAVANSFRRYCFQSSRVKAQFRFYAVGTKVLGVNKSNIRKIEIAVPPRPEQEAIAEVLIDADREIVSIERKLDKMRRLKQGMMQELLTGRIRLDVDEAHKAELVAAT